MSWLEQYSASIYNEMLFTRVQPHVISYYLLRRDRMCRRLIAAAASLFIACVRARAISLTQPRVARLVLDAFLPS